MAYQMQLENYYEVLEIPRSASFEEINSQFKSLALRYHPLRNPTNMQTNQMKFRQVCEAHDVLSNIENKAIYDTYGEYGLKEGCVTPDGRKIGGGYFLKSNPESYFERILSKTEFILEERAINGTDVQQSIFSDCFGGLNQKGAEKPENIVLTVNCTLEEFYNGSIKQVEYTRNEVQHDAKTIKCERKTQQIEVKPGFNESSELLFKKKGHQSPGHIDADLIIKFKEVAHSDYRRVGHDLVLTKKISLLEAFECIPCRFSTLDGRQLAIAVDEQICPQTCKLVEDEGMPVEGTATKGNLYIRFDIQFPAQLKQETKQCLLTALEANQEQQ